MSFYKVILLLIIFFCAYTLQSQEKVYISKKISSDRSYTFRTARIGPSENLSTAFLSVKGKIQGRPDLTFMYRDSLAQTSFKYLVRISSRRNNTKGRSAEDFQVWAHKIKAIKEFSGPEFITRKIIKNKNEFVLIKQFRKALYNHAKDSVEAAQIIYIIINERYNNELILIDITEVGPQLDIDKTINYFDQFSKEIKPIRPYYNKKWDVNFLFVPTLFYDERESGFTYRYYSQNEWRGSVQKIQMHFNGTGVSAGRHIKNNFWINARYTNYGKASNTREEYSTVDDTTGIPALYNSVFSRSSISTIGLYAEKRIFVSRRTSADLDLGFIYATNFDFTFIERTSQGGLATEHKVYYNPAAGFEWGAKYRILIANHNCGIFLGIRSMSLKYNYRKYTIDGVDSNLSTGNYFLPKINKLNFSGVQFQLGTTFQF